MIEATVIAGTAGWFGRCLNLDPSDPVTFSFHPHIAGDFNAARIRAFDATSSEYISYVDPDDELVPGAFKACADALEANPDCGGAYTWEDLIGADSEPLPYAPIRTTSAELVVNNPQAAHHLIVVRRRVYEAIRPFVLRDRWGFDWALAVAAQTLGGLVNVPMVGYRWRLHGANSCLFNAPGRGYGARARDFLTA